MLINEEFFALSKINKFQFSDSFFFCFVQVFWLLNHDFVFFHSCTEPVLCLRVITGWRHSSISIVLYGIWRGLCFAHKKCWRTSSWLNSPTPPHTVLLNFLLLSLPKRPLQMCSWSTIKGQRKKLKNPFDECRKRLKDSCGVICLWTFNLFLFSNDSQCYQQEMKESLNGAKCFQDRMHLLHFAQKFSPERPENYCSLNRTTNEPETF